MEIINNLAMLDSPAYTCSSDLFAPVHTCYDAGGGNHPGCIALCTEHANYGTD